ncbi:MAG TPA: fasciclin domain-containing protein [Mucilaginibacter sp.]|nr:fasciclin domain-containing protein [Mucilaginibacter sp.]
MKKSILIAALISVIGLASNNVFAQTTPAQPAQPPAQSADTAKQTARADSVRDVEGTLENVADLTSFVKAIKAVKLDSILTGAGPYTVFVPGNAAFGAIPASHLDSLMKDTAKLTTMVKAHIVAGKFDKAAIIKALTNKDRTAALKTIDGQTIVISVVDKKLQLQDAEGNTAEVTSFDTPATNGVIHGINGVLMYK